VQLVNFSVVPAHLQIPFCAGVSFIWTVILSMMRGSDTGAVRKDAKVEQHVAQLGKVAATEVPVPSGASEEPKHRAGSTAVGAEAQISKQVTAHVLSAQGKRTGAWLPRVERASACPCARIAVQV
jgi:tagatose-1,6-bisphosphate aldolase non-catalytic subunit AgaZ/GatZ